MEIRILGSVEARVNDLPVELRSERARRLLALLARQPFEFVADDFLIDRVWDDDRPVRPRDALYTCASRLRQALRGSRGRPADLLSRRRGGYLLSVDPQAVDLHRFRFLVRSARDAVRRAERTPALDLFDQALALWRGTPLLDLGSSWSDRVRVGLERELLSVRVDRSQLALSLGRHLESVPSLYQLAEEHPLDEAIAELLIQALYRSGRQGESLACFASIRQRLVQELGDGPGASLHQLHSRVLRRDPSLHVAASHTSSGT
ncbi:BTAD domain-containing putative transcriptional regulator [Streptomyces sp. NPDC051569]|uniref:AfsR/SARP family transcriptional regulator n=1 Tax=Streptomyces sp. NPDC051569 TaxID=3365661 RepID=UPI00378983AA